MNTAAGRPAANQIDPVQFVSFADATTTSISQFFIEHAEELRIFLY